MNAKIFLDEYHIDYKIIRIKYLEREIQKIEAGIIKASSQEILNDILFGYKKELDKLKNSELSD
ncbi:hypothetical protein ACWA5Z_10000 [Testudinibacter sp. P80/BLE/0925]|uniref:hypothetical protein n=1 Tax=Testudinibacter sp. TW-1 TaxID=3417757 RepID=UPI003D36E992